MTEKSKVGDVRAFAGIAFTAVESRYYPGEKLYWKAGPLALAVVEDLRPCEIAGDHPFSVNAIHCRTFEDAAIRAIKVRAVEARKARELIAEYDAPELAEDRAKVEALA